MLKESSRMITSVERAFFLKPGVGYLRVSSFDAESGKQIRAAIEQPEYKNKSFGVVSLVGEDQALEIERLLREHVHPAEVHAGRADFPFDRAYRGHPRQIHRDQAHRLLHRRMRRRVEAHEAEGGADRTETALQVRVLRHARPIA